MDRSGPDLWKVLRAKLLYAKAEGTNLLCSIWAKLHKGDELVEPLTPAFDVGVSVSNYVGVLDILQGSIGASVNIYTLCSKSPSRFAQFAAPVPLVIPA